MRDGICWRGRQRRIAYGKGHYQRVSVFCKTMMNEHGKHRLKATASFMLPICYGAIYPHGSILTMCCNRKETSSKIRVTTCCLRTLKYDFTRIQIWSINVYGAPWKRTSGVPGDGQGVRAVITGGNDVPTLRFGMLPSAYFDWNSTPIQPSAS